VILSKLQFVMLVKSAGHFGSSVRAYPCFCKETRSITLLGWDAGSEL
jgi:hypothetical protein